MKKKKTKKRFLSNPDPGENLVSGNLVMETGCVPRSCVPVGLDSDGLLRKSIGHARWYDNNKNKYIYIYIYIL